MSETRNGGPPSLTPEPFTVEAIERDAWVAVNRPIPEAPSDELLKVARDAVARCVEDSDLDMRTSANLGIEDRSLDESNHGALARADELDEILRAREQSRQPMTIEAIKRDPWNAVVLDLPENGTPQLYEAAAIAAEVLYHTPPEELLTPPFALPTNDDEWADLGAEIKTRWRDAQQKAYDAAEALDAQPRQGAAPEVGDAGYSRWTGEPLGVLEPMTIEAIERDPWAAIQKLIPEAPSDELLKVAHDAVGRCLDELKPGSERYVGGMHRLAELEWTAAAGAAQSASKGQSQR